MCAKIRVWSCLVTDNFGLFTEIAVCKLLRGWRSYGPKPVLFCPLYVLIHFSAAFCRAHWALNLARDHAPYKKLQKNADVKSLVTVVITDPAPFIKYSLQGQVSVYL